MTTGKKYKRPWRFLVAVGSWPGDALGVAPLWRRPSPAPSAELVKDSSGAVIPGGQSSRYEQSHPRERDHGDEWYGRLRVPFLNSSTYQVAFTKEGFKTDVEENVPLVLNQQTHVDAVMQVGNTKPIDYRHLGASAVGSGFGGDRRFHFEC